jgi:iron complex transport system substrate-binding protein
MRSRQAPFRPLRLAAVVALVAAGLRGEGESASAASRIVSTAPSFTEILYALGAGDRVAAVSDYCQYPEPARSRPRVGGPFNLNFERILSLRADLVLLPQSLEGAADRCRVLGLPVLQLPNETIEDLLQSIETLGVITGTRQAASELAGRIRRELDRPAPPGPPVRALIVVFRAPDTLQDLTVASRDTFLSELLRRAGGENLIGSSISRYPRVSKEEVVALDPEVVLDLTFTASPERTPAIWSQLPSLTAVRRGRVVAYPDPAATIPGPRLVETLARFREILHPREAGR